MGKHYDTKELKKRCIKAIKENRLFFIGDIPTFVGVSKDTIYRHFPVGSDDYKEILDNLLAERSRLKVSMRAKWYLSDAPALQIGLYRLIADEEERKRLAQQYIKQEGAPIAVNIDWDSLPEETVAQIYGALNDTTSQGSD